MPDNFFKTDPAESQEDQQQEQPAKIKLGDAEYEQEELDKLVGLGKKAQGIEKDYGSLDKFVSESGRRAQELGTLKKELDELKEKASRPPASQQLTPEQKETAKRQLEDLLGGRVLTEKEATKLYAAQRAGERLLEECSDLEAEIDGKDGRPKFDKESVLNHMSETGIKNPLKAYKDLYEEDLDRWREKQLSKPKRSMDTLETLPSEKQPKPPKITKANLSDAVREALWGAREE